jgi:transcriptional regulator with XRE-family HTH domain
VNDDDRYVSCDDIAGLAEVAEALGVSRQAVSNWAAGRSRPNFPAPLKKLRATPLYSLTEARQWYARQHED